MENCNDYGEIDLVNFFRVIKRGKKIMFVCLAIGLFIATGIFIFKNIGIIPRTYETVFGIKTGSAGEDSIKGPDELVGEINYGVFNKSINLSPADTVFATVIPGTKIIEVRVTSRNQEKAKGYASDLVSAILSEQEDLLKSYEKQINQGIVRAEQAMGKFTSMNQQTAEIQLMGLDLRNQLEDTIPPSLISGPDTSYKKQSIVFTLIIGAFLGFFIGLVLVFGKEWWNKNKGRTRNA